MTAQVAGGGEDGGGAEGVDAPPVLGKVKEAPDNVSLETMLTEIDKLPSVRACGPPPDLFIDVAPKVVAGRRARAAVESGRGAGTLGAPSPGAHSAGGGPLLRTPVCTAERVRRCPSGADRQDRSGVRHQPACLRHARRTPRSGSPQRRTMGEVAAPGTARAGGLTQHADRSAGQACCPTGPRASRSPGLQPGQPARTRCRGLAQCPRRCHVELHPRRHGSSPRDQGISGRAAVILTCERPGTGTPPCTWRRPLPRR